MTDVIDFIIRHNIGDWELNKAVEHFNANQRPGCAHFVQRLAANATEAYKAFYSLLDFYRKNGLNAMLLGDVESLANWGLTFRNNEQVLVIIDAGFSQDVYDKYYI